MEDYDTVLKEVLRFSRMQKQIFETNKQLLEENIGNVKLLENIRQQYENELYSMQYGKRTDVLMSIAGLFKIIEVEKQISYFRDEIEPNRDRFCVDPLTRKEYGRAKAFVLANSSELFVESLETDYDNCKYTDQLIAIDEFLTSMDHFEHVSKGLSVIFKQFISQIEANLTNENIKFYELFTLVMQDMQNFFVTPDLHRKNLVGYFLNFIKNRIADQIYFKYHNNIEKFMVVLVNLYEFFNDIRESEQFTDKVLSEAETVCFQTLKSFLANYYDKLELLKVIDQKYRLFSAIYRKFEDASLKVWLAELIEAYLENIHFKESETIEK